jgi:outer membrane protein assembly factor BamB
MQVHSTSQASSGRAHARRRPRAALRFIAALAAGGLAAWASAQAADWPQFGQTARHVNSDASERAFTPDNVGGLVVKWNANMGANVSTEGGAVIAGRRLFVAGFDGRLSAFDLAGCGADVCDPLWQGRTRNDITTTPAARDGVVVVSSADRFIHVFDAAGCGATLCDALWRGRLKQAPVDSSPAIAGGFIYVGDLAGNLSVFALAGCGQDLCDPVWTAHAGPHESMNSTPAVWGGSVFVQTTYSTDFDVTGRLLVFPDGCGQSTCAPAWSADLGGQAGKASGPVVALGRVFAGSSRRFGRPNRRDHVFAFDASGCGQAVCEPIQTFDVGPEGIDTTLAVSGTRLYASTNASPDPNTVGVVMAFDVASCGMRCKPEWTGVNFTEGFLSAPVVTRDVVFVGKGPALEVDAGVFAFDANGCGQETCRALALVRANESGNYLGAPLAIARDAIAFVNNDNDLGRSQVTVIGLP